MRSDISSHEGEVERLGDIAEGLMESSKESRLATTLTHVRSRYDALQTSCKELRTKWEGYVDQHQQYRQNYNDLTNWLRQTKDQVDSVGHMSGDQDDLILKRQQLQRILDDKEKGFTMLNSAVELGERLYPDTASSGRDKIRQQLRTAKDVWDNLISDATDKQRKLDTAVSQLASYTEGMDDLHKWMAETQAWLKSDLSLKNTLQEKRSQLHNTKALLQDVTSHGRVLQGVLDQAQSVYQATQAPEIHKLMGDTTKKYEDLQSLAKEEVTRLEAQVTEHAHYIETVQSTTEWLNLMMERLQLCADLRGDRHSIANKRERVQVK